MTAFPPRRPVMVPQSGLATGGMTATRAEHAPAARSEARGGLSDTLRTPTTHLFA